MQKMQILFPEPQMKRLRDLARIEDRPISEIVRRAVERDLEQRTGRLHQKSPDPPAFPTFDGGAIKADAAEMKEILHAEDIR